MFNQTFFHNAGFFLKAKTKLFLLILFSWLFYSYGVSGQVIDSATIKNLLNRVEARQMAYPIEKVYLNFDKPYYAAGDTAWVKAYVLMHDRASRSVKLYIEMLNDNGQLVQRLTLPVFDGLAQGFFAFDARRIAEGSYTMRAYTNWQQNFGPDYFFYKQLYIGKLGGKTWLLTEQHKRGTGVDSNRVQLAMKFNDSQGRPLIAQQMTVKLLEGNKPILKSDMTTGVDGILNSSLILPVKVSRKTLNILVEDANDKEQHIIFPFYPSGVNGDIDLQFMPEGGSLITGLYNRVAFKAIGEDGLSRDVEGQVFDSKNEEVATIQSLKYGMGNFVLVPQPGEHYTAKITVNGKTKLFPIPPVKAQGIALRIDGIAHPDDLYVYITTNNMTDDKSYTLIAQSADRVYFGSPFKFNNEGYFNTHIAKNKFPTGIISLVIADQNNHVLNQRNVFVNRHDNLKIAMVTSQASFKPKDSVDLKLNVFNSDGAPVNGSFSVSVTDDAQIKDTAPQNNIQSQILLTSELKGHIENPAWYFTPGDEKLKEKALDNLLLTQGWQGFNWDYTDAAIPVPAFKPETDLSISGKLTNFFNRPSKNVKVTLLTKGKLQTEVTDTLSDDKGWFKFDKLPLIDTVSYLIKLHNAKDKTLAAGINVEEFKPTSAKLPFTQPSPPWNFNADTALINFINKSNQRNAQLAAEFTIPGTTGKVLKQVDVKAQRKIKFVGGEFSTEIATINEQELIDAKKATLKDLLYKKFPGFKESHLYALDNGGSSSGRVQQREMAFVNNSLWIADLIVDGQSVTDPTSIVDDQEKNLPTAMADRDEPAGQSLSNPNGKLSETTKLNNAIGRSAPEVSKESYDAINSFLTTISADDVKSISLYRGYHVWLSVTTRSGAGANTRTALGTYAFRPLPLQLPRAFYRPRYTVKTTQPDLRSTIHWEPNLVTDASGNAKLSFYAADKPSIYTVVIEGTDMQGHFGVSTQKITVSPAP